MVILIVAVILALVFLTWTLCRAAAVGDSISRGQHLRTAFEEPFSQGRRKWSVMEAMCIVFVFAALVCLGLLSPFLYAAAAVLSMAANLLRRLIRLIGGSR